MTAASRVAKNTLAAAPCSVPCNTDHPRAKKDPCTGSGPLDPTGWAPRIDGVPGWRRKKADQAEL